jgi:hypothetical protein
MQATLSERELIQVGINREKASFALQMTLHSLGKEEVKQRPQWKRRDSIKEEHINL